MFCHGDEIFAGNHWNCESRGWDTAISVTGKLIDRGLKDKAHAVLKELSEACKKGLIQNRFPDKYQTSDPSLWLIHALFSVGTDGGGFLYEQNDSVIASILENYPISDVAVPDIT